MMIKKRILIFLAFAFGIPWISALVISQSSLRINNPTQTGAIANYIFILTPWLANIATRLITREGWGNLYLRPKFKHSWRFYLAAWLLPLLATLLGGGIFFLLYPESFDSTLGVVRKLIENSPSAAVSPPLVLLSMTLSMMFISIPINTIVSIGEEFGWRAYLFPKLIKGFSGNNLIKTVSNGDPLNSNGYTIAGVRKAALLTGLIHGVWHLPLILMTVNIIPEVTYLTPMVYLLFTCSMSILLSWVTLSSGSVWPASLGHGAINTTAALPGYFLKGTAIPLIGPDPITLVGGIGYIILALVLFFIVKPFTRRKKGKFIIN